MAEAAKKPDTSDGKDAKGPAKSVMDVSRPGKSAPPPNSKSVIVGNRPMLKDPMMVKDEADNSLVKVSKKAKDRLLTAPLLETEKPDAPETAASQKQPKTDKAASPAKPAKKLTPIDTEPEDKPDAKPAEPTEQTEPEPAKPESKPQETEPEEPQSKSEEPKPEPKADAPQTEDDKETPTAPAKDKNNAVDAEKDEKEAKRQAAIEKLADSKKYYLPINMVEKRRSKHFAVVGILLSLLLVVAWADIALDAGLIHIKGIKPVTHFFSN